jgi:hypothetical protein
LDYFAGAVKICRLCRQAIFEPKRLLGILDRVISMHQRTQGAEVAVFIALDEDLSKGSTALMAIAVWSDQSRRRVSKLTARNKLVEL